MTLGDFEHSVFYKSQVNSSCPLHCNFSRHRYFYVSKINWF